MPLTNEEEIANIKKDIEHLKAGQKWWQTWLKRFAWIGWVVAGAAVGFGYKEVKDMPQQVYEQVKPQVAAEVERQLPDGVKDKINGDLNDAKVAKLSAENAASDAQRVTAQITALLNSDTKLLKHLSLESGDNLTIIYGSGDNTHELQFDTNGNIVDYYQRGGHKFKNFVAFTGEQKND